MFNGDVNNLSYIHLGKINKTRKSFSTPLIPVSGGGWLEPILAARCKVGSNSRHTALPSQGALTHIHTHTRTV